MPIPFYAVIETEVRRTETFAASNPLRFANDPAQITLVIRAALNHPDWTTNQILDWNDRQSATPIKFSVVRFLRKHYILRRGHRAECRQEIERQSENLRTLLLGQDDSASAAWADLSMRPKRIRRSWPVVARMVLLDLSQMLAQSTDVQDRLLAKRIEEVLEKVLLRPSAQLLSRVVRGVSEERRFTDRETLTEKLLGLIEEVAGLREEGEEDTSDLEAMQEENADLKAALFGLTQELMDLQTRIQEMQDTTKTEAIVNFLSEMNSPTSGYLLDNVVQSNRATTQLLQDGWLPEPPEVEGVVYSLKMLMDYLKNIGVTPMQAIGDHAKVSMEDLAYLNYSGSEFKNEAELKWIEFRSSGWIYKGEIISRPRAVESTEPITNQGG